MRAKSNKWLAGAVLGSVLAIVFARPAPAQHDTSADNTHHFATDPVNGKGGEAVSGPYSVVPGWPVPLSTEWTTGRVAGIYAESPDRVYVATTGELPTHLYERAWGPLFIPKFIPALGDLSRNKGRWEHIVMVFDRNGKLVEDWSQWNNKFKSPNRLLISPYDPDKHVWIVDQEGGGVMEFTHDGKTLTMQIQAKDVPAEFKDDFGTQDMAFMPNGDFYVVGGSHVFKFSKDGKYLTGFGQRGGGPGEFNGMHGIITDPDNHRIYIADRGNSRIEVVDENGKYLDEWPNMPAPYCIRLAKDRKHIWVSDGYTQLFAKYDLNGKLDESSTWGTFGVTPGAIWGPHYFEVDSEGSLYVAEDYNGRIQKFRPRAGGDKAKLIDVTR